MEDEITSLEKIPDSYQTKEPITLWKWYFGWHPRIFLTVPAFLTFVYSGFWFIWAEIHDVIYFFQTKPISWGSIILVLIFGSFLLSFIIAPIYICFASIDWLYEINIGNNTAWKKFLYSVGIILLVIFGTGIIRLLITWVLSIL